MEDVRTKIFNVGQSDAGPILCIHACILVYTSIINYWYEFADDIRHAHLFEWRHGRNDM